MWLDGGGFLELKQKIVLFFALFWISRNHHHHQTSVCVIMTVMTMLSLSIVHCRMPKPAMIEGLGYDDLSIVVPSVALKQLSLLANDSKVINT